MRVACLLLLGLAACDAPGTATGGLGIGNPCTADWQCRDDFACNGVEE